MILKRQCSWHILKTCKASRSECLLLPTCQTYNAFFGVCLAFPGKFHFFWILKFPRKFQNPNLFWKIFWNSSTNTGILKFPREFQNIFLKFKISSIVLEFRKIFQKRLGFWNFLGNSKILKIFFGIPQEIPKFQYLGLNSQRSSKKGWNFGIS